MFEGNLNISQPLDVLSFGFQIYQPKKHAGSTLC